MTEFRNWWTKGDPDSAAGQLALASPIAESARATFEAGQFSERQRIREAVFDNPERLIGKRRHGETMMSWRQRALHAALETDTTDG